MVTAPFEQGNDGQAVVTETQVVEPLIPCIASDELCPSETPAARPACNDLVPSVLLLELLDEQPMTHTQTNIVRMLHFSTLVPCSVGELDHSNLMRSHTTLMQLHQMYPMPV